MKAPTKPGQFCDKNGVPIYPGDLVKSHHFTGRRRKKYYLYHVAIWEPEHQAMELVPTAELEPTKRGQGGRFWLLNDLDDSEIISGHGPEPYLCYDERPRRKV